MKNNFLTSWTGTVEINGVVFDDIQSDFKFSDNSIIILHSKTECSAGQIAKASDKVYRVVVRQYMTKQSTPDFDFMAKWNNDVPMPLMTMVGTIEKETSGMYKMSLKADTSFDLIQTCMKCGRPITNNVSKYFGMGPECGQHNYTNPFSSDSELNLAVQTYKKEVLSKIEWNGWIPKKAITKMEEI